MQHRYHVAMLRHRDEFASLPGVWAKSRGSQKKKKKKKQSRSSKKAWQAQKEKKNIRGQTAWIHSVFVWSVWSCLQWVTVGSLESWSLVWHGGKWENSDNPINCFDAEDFLVPPSRFACFFSKPSVMTNCIFKVHLGFWKLGRNSFLNFPVNLCTKCWLDEKRNH